MTELEQVEPNEGTIGSLRPFRQLAPLRSLKISGRRIRSLDGMEGLSALENLCEELHLAQRLGDAHQVGER
mgnify:CR=1 FL=1